VPSSSGYVLGHGESSWVCGKRSRQCMLGKRSCKFGEITNRCLGRSQLKKHRVFDCGPAGPAWHSQEMRSVAFDNCIRVNQNENVSLPHHPRQVGAEQGGHHACSYVTRVHLRAHTSVITATYVSSLPEARRTTSCGDGPTSVEGIPIKESRYDS
jgi:hypothetical protein